MISIHRPLSSQNILKKVLDDFQQRKHESSLVWFTADDLKRLNIPLSPLSCMQTIQHSLKLNRSSLRIDARGHLDRFSITEGHR
ncbi:MAG: hypothetical protein ACO25G_03430 [Holophagaceae bacterium]|jgi:hypothetical protein|nr:hypothetical protein [Acidobacteriota bacterium]